MTGRVFNKISPALWASPRFLGLSDRGKLCFIYFCTNAHVTSAGCYVLPNGYACADLHCDLETYLAMRTEVLEAGMIDFDPDHSVVLIDKWFRHNPPTNEKYAIGTTRRIADIPSEPLRKKAGEALAQVEETRVAKLARDEAAKEARRVMKQLGGQSALGSDTHLTNTAFMRGQRR
ncbi:MAG: hypothetical protein EOR72_32245 [Mesorhizobium sp.]|uniref:hypothetical protein n=1 Tax=Mesorhizobium sp. TaxID=1871066 RepID=UPI000FE94B5E|nr:hypothetical protein [Mesorhizobium sp.]RWM06067.1 MAG: hypothetical protein EOR72_32245 [Mesorhizobium sp.]